MRRSGRVFLVLLLVLFAIQMPAKPAFSGVYTISGTNPGVGAYKGTLTIAPRGDVYDVHWTVAGLQYVGVGVVVNDTLAVTYSGASDRSWSGVMAYRAKTDGSLEGRWALLGGQARAGTETAVRK